MVTHRFCVIASLTMALSLLASLGCGSRTEIKSGTGSAKPTTPRDSSNDPVPGPQTEPPLTQSSDPIAPAGGVSANVLVVDRAGFDEVLAKHKGQVVLVDFWATWCPACRKKFPHTVALAKEHQADGFAVIGVAMDDDDAHEEVVKFLTDQHATFENLRSKGGLSDEAFESFEIPGMSLPCLRLFDREGKAIKTFAYDDTADKQFTDDDVAEAVKAALGK
jgi:thiol-disulfide isomerase/thioredoxin